MISKSNVVGFPKQVRLFELYEPVTVIVEYTGIVELFTTVNGLTSPFPEDARPIELLLAVQANETFELIVLEKDTRVDKSPLQIV